MSQPSSAPYPASTGDVTATTVAAMAPTTAAPVTCHSARTERGRLCSGRSPACAWTPPVSSDDVMGGGVPGRDPGPPDRGPGWGRGGAPEAAEFSTPAVLAAPPPTTRTHPCGGRAPHRDQPALRHRPGSWWRPSGAGGGRNLGGVVRLAAGLVVRRRGPARLPLYTAGSSSGSSHRKPAPEARPAGGRRTRRGSSGAPGRSPW